MSELAAMIKEDRAALEVRRLKNRERFPTVTGWVDQFNAAGLGPVRVIWCEENGQRAGNPNG